MKNNTVESIILFIAIVATLLFALILVLAVASLDGYYEKTLIDKEVLQAKSVLSRCYYVEHVEMYARQNYLKDWEDYR